jgi:hypothetical protein
VAESLTARAGKVCRTMADKMFGQYRYEKYSIARLG